jgi:hypothetical protein
VKRLVHWAASPAGPALLLGAVLVYYLGYVKDDAFISFRYAANWAAGRGLCFNEGEAVEGYTNFLWVAAVAGLLRLGVPALLGAKLLGALTAFAGLHWVRQLAHRLDSPARGEGVLDAPSRAAWLYAASPTVGLWAASGMEPTAMMALAAGSALLVLRAADRASFAAALPAGLALAACALLRPEGHALLLLGLLAPRSLLFALPPLAAYHAWRLHLFGALLPNTFLIKSGAGSLVDGLSYAGVALLFYGHALLLGCALWRLRADRRWAVRLLVALALAFVAYLVYVGNDEMRYFRLYAPALPFLFVLAAPRLPRYSLAAFLLFGLITHGAGWKLRSYVEQGRRSYAQLGATIAERARPGDWALFQDCGAAPFRALRVPFLDPIGLTSRKVALLYAEARWSPFRGAGPPPLEARLREELLRPRPRFLAFVVYLEGEQRKLVRERFAVDPEGSMRPYLDENPYSHGIPDDPRFRAGYRFVKAWRRNDGYYLVLFERAGS